MTMLASSPADRRMARVVQENGADPQPAHDIKYRQDAANYVAAMLAELRQIAAKAGFDKLVATIDAAYYDAYGATDAKTRETAPLPRNGTQGAAAEKTPPAMEPEGA